MRTPAISQHVPAAVPLKHDASVIGLVGVAHASSHFGHLLLPPLFPVFMQEFSLSFAQLGLLMTIFFAVSGLGQAASGFIVDRLGARPILYAALALFAMAALVASRAQGYGDLMLVAVMLGAANATFHPVDFTILNQRVSPRRLGHAFSAHGLTGYLGWALAPVFLSSFTVWFDWRAAYLAAAMLYLAVLALVMVRGDQLRVERVAPPASAGAVETSTAFMRLPVVWWCFGYFLFSTVTLAVVQNFSIPILKAMHNISFESATLTLTVYLLCGAAGMLVGGFVAGAARQSEQVVAAAMALGCGLLVLCATGWLGPTGTMAVLASTGFAVGVGAPSRDLMVKKATPKGATGRVYGLVYSGLDTGMALAPLIFGALMDQQHYAITLLGAATTLAVSVFLALGVGQRTIQPQSAVRA